MRTRDSRRHSTSSFSENVVVVETTYQILEVVFLHLRLGDGLTSFIENNSANFSGEISASKLSGMSIQCFFSFFEYPRKRKKSNLAVVVVLDHESKGPDRSSSP